MVHQLLILSDAHLFGSRNEELFGVNTYHSLERLTNHIRHTEGISDLLMASGDLSEDGQSRSYEYFHEMTRGLAISTIWMKGNHDLFENIPEKLAEEYLHTEWFMDPWGFIILDTTIEGKDEGELSSLEFQRLERFLETNTRKHILIFMHHQPVDVGSEFIDILGLQNKHTFWEQTRKYRNIRGIVFGHVHQEYDAYHHGIRVLSTPSTSMQFKPFSSKLDFDEPTHGYRKIRLSADGTIHTEVCRISAEK